MAKKVKKISKQKMADGVMWVVFVALVVGFIVGYLIARSRYIQKISVISEDLMQSANQVNVLNDKLNRYVMINGSVMQVKDGNLSPMTDDVTLSDGTKVTTKGEVVKTDGSTVMMTDGDWVAMNGTLTLAQ